MNGNRVSDFRLEDWLPYWLSPNDLIAFLAAGAVLVAFAGPDEGQGSARSIPGFDLLDGLHACSEHLGRYGGHRAAAGLTISRQALDLVAWLVAKPGRV